MTLSILKLKTECRASKNGEITKQRVSALMFFLHIIWFLLMEEKQLWHSGHYKEQCS